MKATKRLWVGVVLCAALFALTGCAGKNIDVDEGFTMIDKVCELATLKCYYHNVAELEQEAEGFFKVLGTGYKKFWVEYSGVVYVGIDIGKVTISTPDSNGVVRIYVPQAEVQGVDFDIETISDPITEKGIMTKITMEEKTQALSRSQEKMRETAANDEAILQQATERAKSILREYVENVGEQLGKTYVVEWIEEEQKDI